MGQVFYEEAVLRLFINMSGYFDPSSNPPLGRMNDPGSYQMYNNQYNDGHFQRLGGPSSHFDGVAFWYRPDTQEPIYERDPTRYNQVAAPQPNDMDASNIKHRRTRSGCFTCRSRRVKVRWQSEARFHD